MPHTNCFEFSRSLHTCSPLAQNRETERVPSVVPIRMLPGICFFSVPFACLRDLPTAFTPGVGQNRCELVVVGVQVLVTTFYEVDVDLTGGRRNTHHQLLKIMLLCPVPPTVTSERISDQSANAWLRRALLGAISAQVVGQWLPKPFDHRTPRKRP